MTMSERTNSSQNFTGGLEQLKKGARIESPRQQRMHSQQAAAKLSAEMREIEGYWREALSDEERALSLAAMLMVIPDGLELLHKSWILDRLDMEDRAALERSFEHT